MRVVAGLAKGRRLVLPEGSAIRPTADRVREATFNALGSLALIEGVTVLDLFAGSGALGIEALSRGAASAVFVDRDRGARAAIEQNLNATGLVDRATVVAMPAERFLVTNGRRFDLAFLDPPYAYDGWDALLEGLEARTVVIESDRAIELPSAWEVVRSKQYGSTLMVIARPSTTE